MDVFFGAVLLVLAGGLVLLFAMMGELASRLPAATAPAERSKDVFPLEDGLLGGSAETWPAEIAGLGDRDGQTYLMVLSTACSACQDVAAQLAEELDRDEVADVGVVVSTADRARGEEFVREFGLHRLPYYVDEGGTWAAGELNIRMSPTAAVIDRGRVVSALVFHDIAALRTASTSVKGVA